jgi:Fe-S oxidoreductase
MTEILLKNVFENLDEIKYSRQRCIRCNMCKFPPLARVEHKDHSIGCPSYEEFLFTANTGGGMVIMADSLNEGRSKISDEVKDIIFGCTLCGACDVSCKYGTDIEIFETQLLLRKKVFDEGKTYPNHKKILESIIDNNHPIITKVSKNNQALNVFSNNKADTLIWVGPNFSYEPRLAKWLDQIISLLKKAGKQFQILTNKEPYAGRAALEIGDQELFKNQAYKTVRAIDSSGAKEVVCLSAEDFSTLRSQIPKYKSINVPVKHITELYDELIKSKKIKLKRVPSLLNVAWHDPCYLGRLGGQFKHWQGVIKKSNGLPIYEPARPINYGTGGVFEPPRNILNKLLVEELKEFSRRNEYTFNAGETGQTVAIMPEFVYATAHRRLQEAEDLGIQTIVTECPLAYLSLQKAAKDFVDIKIISLTQVISQAIEDK